MSAWRRSRCTRFPGARRDGVRFLLDANLPRSAVAAFVAAGHEAEHVRALGLGDASDDAIAQAALESDAVLVSRDFDFANLRRFDPLERPGLLVLRIPETSLAADIVALLARFLASEWPVHLPGHLAILESERIRFRPALNND